MKKEVSAMLRKQHYRYFFWNQTVDIHKSYWDMIRGNTDYYYAIRESLIVGIVENSGIVYNQIGEQTFELRKGA